ncbi:membrane lipoprotein TpN32 precursor [Andreesenia angusta]|uniref:Membrane lipoprotein TpN32 n=1 Tax=Andreesenia angusta TaxID=39480 RepID=A0A1S1V9C2_9FIRM|nr:MetQ/NlpA family ABC transporter substrate-binding protein [Andreesenia angusta]OHW63192.1 membrane lipoprotein TpN32 precursor [Andreesenia angusta]
MKKILLALSLATTMFVAGCSGSGENSSSIKVGATPEPHGKILELVKDDLESEGIQLEIVDYSDYVQPNLALNDGEIDANFMQHEPYLENFVAERGVDLVSVAKIHIEPMGLYSESIKSIDELADGAKIAIPNDPTNGARALLLLEEKGLIVLDENAGFNATEKDIVENPKNLQVQALEAAQLPRTLQDFDASVINGNYALEAGLNPTTDAILIEAKDSPYANIITVKSGNENDEKVQALIKALQSDEVKNFIEDNYEGGVIPAF